VFACIDFDVDVDVDVFVCCVCICIHLHVCPCQGINACKLRYRSAVIVCMTLIDVNMTLSKYCYRTVTSICATPFKLPRN
jgi:hypothetical protein